jgi:hypothetical protein
VILGPLVRTRGVRNGGTCRVRHCAVGVGFRSAKCPTWHHANGRGERPLPWGSQALGPERVGGWLRASRAAWRDSGAVRPHGILGERVTEKRVPGTRKAVETTGGDRWQSIGSRDSGRQREASWSGGEAERDRRPVFRRTSSAAPGSSTRVAENQRQGQRPRQGQRQRSAPGPEAAAALGHGAVHGPHRPFTPHCPELRYHPSDRKQRQRGRSTSCRF